MASIEQITVTVRGDSVYRIGIDPDAFSLTAGQESEVLSRVQSLDESVTSVSSPTGNDAIRLACYQVEEYGSISSSELASTVTALDTCVVGTARELMEAIVSASADASATTDELSALYTDLPQMLEDVRTNIATGSSPGLRTLASLFISAYQRATGSALSQATKDAIGPGVDAVSKSLVKIKAEELGISPPSDVTATDVDTALGR